MNYEEAKKLLAKETKKDNYIRITIGYSADLILPYKDGIQLLAALGTAESYSEEWKSDSRTNDRVIRSIEKSNINVRFMSHSDYQDIKIAQLLGVNVSDLKPD